MARDHKLDLSDYRPSTMSTFRPQRDRSRSPKRPRSDSWRPLNSTEDESVRHDGRRWRGKAKPRTGNEYRARSPDHSPDATPQGTHTKSRKRGKSQNNDGATKGLSDRIHSLRRLLEKATDMPADVRLEKERELQGYVTDQQRIKAMREKNAVTSRYHFVRFMERKKADRLLKKLEKNFHRAMMGTDSTALSQGTNAIRIGSNGGDGEGTMDEAYGPQVLSSAERLVLQQEDYKRRLHEAKVDLNYTLYAPLDQKYISLYPSTAKERRDQDGNNLTKAGQDHVESVKDDEAGLLRNESGQKPPLWYEVEKAMENNALEALRDGKVLKADNDGGQALTFRSMAGPANGKRVPGIEAGSGDENQEEESEDDFFER